MLTYLEPSAIDAVVRAGVEPVDFAIRLAKRGLTPCVGFLTINESAQAILSDRGDFARQMFRVISGIDPRILADPASLYKREIHLLRVGESVGPYSDEAQEQFSKDELARLANGEISHEFLSMVEARRRAKFEDWPITMQGYLDSVRGLRREAPKSVPAFRTFRQVEAHFLPKLSAMVQALDELDLHAGEAEQIAERIDSFPAIRSSIYFWLNAQYICLAHGTTPSVDKVDDYRHCIESSYCDLFVSNDHQLLRSLERMQPRVAPLAISDLLSTPAV